MPGDSIEAALQRHGSQGEPPSRDPGPAKTYHKSSACEQLVHLGTLAYTITNGSQWLYMICINGNLTSCSFVVPDIEKNTDYHGSMKMFHVFQMRDAFQRQSSGSQSLGLIDNEVPFHHFSISRSCYRRCRP